jgi:hypothetical protein
VRYWHPLLKQKFKVVFEGCRRKIKGPNVTALGPPKVTRLTDQPRDNLLFVILAELRLRVNRSATTFGG